MNLLARSNASNLNRPTECMGLPCTLSPRIKQLSLEDQFYHEP